jgi:hypothetical protein
MSVSRRDVQRQHWQCKLIPHVFCSAGSNGAHCIVVFAAECGKSDEPVEEF